MKILRFVRTITVVSEKITTDEALEDAYARIGDGWDFDCIIDKDWELEQRTTQRECDVGQCFYCKRPIEDVLKCGCV